MKKLFTWLTILITTSLVGIIILQVTLIRNSIKLREELTKQNLEIALSEVYDHVQASKSQFSNKLPSVMLQEFDLDDALKEFKGPTIAQLYTVDSLNRLIKKIFAKHSLKHIKFEFAVLRENNTAGFDMLTPRFESYQEQALIDTIDKRLFYWQITPLEGSETESLSPKESLLVVIYGIQDDVFRSLAWMVTVAFVFTMIIVAAFYFTVSALFKQKKINEITGDFINNMTHELKTPLATIALSIDAIRSPKVQADPEKFNYYSGVIKAENMRMNKQVETILSASLFDSQKDMQLKKIKIHLHDVLNTVTKQFEVQLLNFGGEIQLSLQAKDDSITGDPVHITNIMSNMVDNAIKYRKDNIPPVVKIKTEDFSGGVRIGIEDNGIGMTKDTASRIFERFYRAHTGNVHNVKGFGLGLSYVKSIIDAHQGKIKVDSVAGKGSTFIIELPHI